MHLLGGIDRRVDPAMLPGVALRGKRLFEPTPPRHEQQQQQQQVPMRSVTPNTNPNTNPNPNPNSNPYLNPNPNPKPNTNPSPNPRHLYYRSASP